MKTRKSLGILGLMILLPSQTAVAQTTSGSSDVGANFVLETLALVLIFACIFVTFKLYRAIRGGKISGGWKWFLFGFSALGVSQLLLFGAHIGVVPIWNSGLWVDVLRVLAVVLLLIGVTRFRKLLA